MAALKPARPLQAMKAKGLDGPLGGRGGGGGAKGGGASAASKPVQLKAPTAARPGPSLASPGAVQAVAQSGFTGSSTALPHLGAIQQAFGDYDVSSVQAFVGGAAADASENLGANAYASGEAVAFKRDPSLHTAAHEAAHVVQQRAGVSLPGGLGRSGDAYEKHADRVADDVVSGRSAVQTLSEMASPVGGAEAVQRSTAPVQREAVTLESVENLLAGRIKVLTVEESGSTATGTAKFRDPGPFQRATWSAKQEDSGLSVKVTSEPSAGTGFSNATLVVEASHAMGGKARVTVDVTVDSLRPLKSFDSTFSGTIDLATGVFELQTGNRIIPLLEIVGGVGLGNAVFNKLRFDPNTGSLDADELAVILTIPGFEELKSTSGRIEAGKTYADVDFRTTTVYIPKRESPLISSKAGGHAVLTAGEWNLPVVGGLAEVNFPGVDAPASINWQASFPDDSGPVYQAALAQPWQIGSAVTIKNAELCVESGKKVTAKGVGTVDLPFLAPETQVEMAFDSETGNLRIAVPKATLDYPSLAKVNARGEISELVLDVSSKSFNSEGKAFFAADLPLIGAVTADLEVRDNRLASGLITTKTKLRIPAGNPLLTGEVDGTLKLADNKFESGDLVADLALHFGDTPTPDVAKVVAHVSETGDVTADATLATDRQLGEHVVWKGGELHYVSSRPPGQNPFDGHLKFAITKVGDVPDLPIDARIAGDSAAPGQGGTRDAEAKGDDSLRYTLDYGLSLRSGLFLHGTFGMDLANVPVSGSFQAGMDVLLGSGKSTGANFSALGIPLMEGSQKEKQLLSIERRRVMLATWGMGGLFAEGGADLRFLLGVDPVVADLSGSFSGISLRSLTPSAGRFKANVTGGVRGQLVGTPTLGLGLWFGTPGLFSARGGVKVPISAVMTAVPKGSVNLTYADGAFGGGAKLNLPLYFGIHSMVEPYLTLAGLYGLIPEFAIPTKVAGPFTLLKTRKVLDLPIELGSIGGPPAKADLLLANEEIPLEDEVEAPNVETKKGPEEKVASEAVEETTEEPGSGEVLEDTSMISSLTSSFKDEPWFQRGQKVLDFLSTVGEWLAGGAEKIGQVLDWIAGYIDIAKFADAIVKTIETTTPPDGKVGLVSLLGKIAGNLGGESEGTTSGTQDQYILSFGGGQVVLKASGESAIVQRNTLEEDVDLGTDPHDGFTWEEGKAKGTLVGDISIGGSDAYGVIKGARFAVDESGVSTQFTGTLEPGSAMGPVSLKGEVSGNFFAQGMNISALRLEQPAEALELPCSVGGVALKAEPQRVSFAQRTPGTWSLLLGSANTVALPFTGGRFIAQLRSYEMTGDSLSAAGMLYAELGWLGKAVADLEIEDNKLKNLSLGLETERFGFPPALTGAAAGKLEVVDGKFDGAEMRVSLFTGMGGEETPIGDASIVTRSTTEGLETELEAKADPSALEKIKLFGMLTPTALEVKKKGSAPIEARGAMGLEIPSFGTMRGDIRYDNSAGFSGDLSGVIDRSEVSGTISGSYDASGVRFDGNASFAIPGFERFDAGLSYAGSRIVFGIDAKTDLIKTKVGNVELSGGIDALSYDFATGNFGGAAHVQGELPILGQVHGAIELAQDHLGIEKGTLKFANDKLAIPTENPVVKGSLATEGEGLVYTAEEGLSGAVVGSGIEADLPGLGKKTVDFRLAFAKTKPSGHLRVASNEEKGDGYFWLKSLEGSFDSTGQIDVGAQVGANIMGNSADLEGRLGPNGFAISATNITIGTPKDVIYGDNISVGYSSAAGVYFAGEARARINDKLQGTIGLRYMPVEGGGKQLDATMSVDATLMEKKPADPITLVDFGIGAPFFSFLPIPITLYGKVGAKAHLTYGMDKALTLRGTAKLTGVDLSEATFQEAEVAPELEGNLFAELVGGPYVGLGAALLLDWAANVTGKIHFAAGARADLDPKLSGVIRYKPGEGVSGGGKLKLPLVMKLVAKPTAELTASLLGGAKTFDFGSMQLAEFDLMKPKTILDLEMNFGTMEAETKSPGSNPSALPDAPEPGEDCKQAPKQVEGSESAPTLEKGDSPGGALDSAPGPFSLGSIIAPLKDKAMAKAAELKAYWDAVVEVGQQLFSRAVAIGAGPYIAVRDTMRWAALFFGGDLSRAREGTESAKTILGIPHIQGYSPQLRDAIKSMSKEQAAKLHGVMSEEEQARSQTNVIGMGGIPALFVGAVFSGPAAPVVIVGGGIAWFGSTVMSGERTRRAKELREGLEASIGLEGALQRDVDRMEEGDRAALRLLFIQFVTVMRDRSLGPVLKALTPPKESELGAFDFRESTGLSMASELRKTSNTTLAEFYKTAEVNELQLIQRYLVEVEGMPRTETTDLFEKVTLTYSALGSGYEVRRRFEEAGLLTNTKLVKKAFLEGTDGSSLKSLRPLVIALHQKDQLDESAWRALATGDPFAFAGWVEKQVSLYSIRPNEIGANMHKLRKIHDFLSELYGDERLIHDRLATIISKFYPGTSYFYISKVHGPSQSEVQEALVRTGIYKDDEQFRKEMAELEELPALEVDKDDEDRSDELRRKMVEAMPELASILPQKLTVGPFSTLEWLTGTSNKTTWTRLWRADEEDACVKLAALKAYATELHTFALPHVPHLPDEKKVSSSRVDALVNRVKGYFYSIYDKLEVTSRVRQQTKSGSSLVTKHPRQEAYRRVAEVLSGHGLGHPSNDSFDRAMIKSGIPSDD